MPKFDRIDKEPVHEKIYRHLRTALMRGEFRPGQSVTIRALADEFGTSPMPVREALKRLVTERALDHLENRSFIVPHMTCERLNELLQIRVVVEGMATERAAQHIQPSDIGTLRAEQKEMALAEAKGDVPTYLRLNQDFHFTIYRAARSQILLPLIESLWLQIGPYLSLLLQRGLPETGATEADKHHDAIINALACGNGSAARAELAADLTDAAGHLMQLIEGTAADVSKVAV